MVANKQFGIMVSHEIMRHNISFFHTTEAMFSLAFSIDL